MKATEDIDLSDLLDPDLRRTPKRIGGFTSELWELVIDKLPPEFSLNDVYKHLAPLRKKRPHVKELEASTRAGLQKLRDAGYIEFLNNQGQYRKIFTR